MHAAPAAPGLSNLPPVQTSEEAQSTRVEHVAPSIPRAAQCIDASQVSPAAQVPFRQGSPEAPRVTQVGGVMVWSHCDPVAHARLGPLDDPLAYEDEPAVLPRYDLGAKPQGAKQ